MPFTYLVPKPRLQVLMSQVNPRLHAEFLERIRVEIHADLTRRMTKPGTFKNPTGALTSSIETYVGGQGIVIYSPHDYAKFIEEGTLPYRPKVGGLRKIPGIGLRRISWKSMMKGKWFYPGIAGKGIFRDSVNAVLGQAGMLVREFETKSRKLA
jgi:hypothetical protein